MRKLVLTAMQCIATTTSAEETEKLAEALGKRLKGGEVIELVSDLGGGKTTFVRGLARGFGSSDRVASPTFTISKLYKAGHKEMHHFDFYRLGDAGVVAHELHDLIDDPQNVVVVEWAEVVHHVLPKERLTILFKSTSDETRQFEFTGPDDLKYLTEGLC